MGWVLLGNDDGVDSPALLPFASALEQALGLPVAVAVPEGERSWSGKAITRGGRVRVSRLTREGRHLAAVTGTPADAIQLGLYGLFAEQFGGAPPTVVVTGVNLGLNAGSAFLASSGTVWAAAEAAYAGLPAVAVSTGASNGDHAAWRRMVVGGDDASRRRWQQVAEASAATVRAIGDGDLLDHCDLVSVNVPWTVTTSAPRTVTSLSPLAYGPLFEPDDEDDHHRSRPRLDLTVTADDDEGGDVAALRAGRISVTPVVLPRSAQVPARTRAALES